ncbi:hypothetical protein RJT34_18208 [Clitoria ternatea]|uniref:Uncharacterized protein n=1 Tax=Clitoria ternatea TaxID=43366 RepID=A0AAN9JAC8_CLITE
MSTIVHEVNYWIVLIQGNTTLVHSSVYVVLDLLVQVPYDSNRISIDDLPISSSHESSVPIAINCGIVWFCANSGTRRLSVVVLVFSPEHHVFS